MRYLIILILLSGCNGKLEANCGFEYYVAEGAIEKMFVDRDVYIACYNTFKI